MDVLDEIAQKHNASVSQVSLNYLFNKPAVSSVVVGSKKMKHLEENIRSTELELDEEDITKIDKVSGATLNNIATFLTGGNIQDSGKKFITMYQVLYNYIFILELSIISYLPYLCYRYNT